MAVGIEGQFISKFNLAKKLNFLDSNALLEFKLVEEAGNVLPTFSLKFQTVDESVFKYLNEGNTLKVSWGKDSNSLRDIDLFITKIESSKLHNGLRVIFVYGFLDRTEYLSEDVYLMEKATSSDMIISANSGLFQIDSNVTSAKDEQVWICPRVSRKKFTNDVWMRSHIPNSIMAVGIGSNNKMYLRDLVKTGNEDYKYRLLIKPERNSNKKDIFIDPDSEVHAESGFINMWQGYGRVRSVYNADTGVSEETDYTIEKVLSSSKALNRTDKIDKRYSPGNIISGNVHDNYWNAYQKNLANLSIMNSVSYRVSFTNVFKRVELFDLMMLKEPEVKNDSSSNEYTSGKHFTSKIVRTISKSVYTTVMELNREAMNSMQGGIS